MLRTSRALAPLVLLAAWLVSEDVHACGGCFHEVALTESTVVTGHRMAMSISPAQSVLWDQIQYDGDPAEFSWVLPVKPGARLELASSAFMDALDAGTLVQVQSPPEGCAPPSGGGSDLDFSCTAKRTMSDTAEPRLTEPAAETGVTVVQQRSVGPYETVTLSTEEPDALQAWLKGNGFELPGAIAPVVSSYVEEGFDFIALKLRPGAGVRQMQPVRVVTPGMATTLPLRMVAAGTGASVDLVLFVIGEGRYETLGFDNVTLPPSLITWNFADDSSDYAELRLAALGMGDGRNWLTSYGGLGALLQSAGSGSYTVRTDDGLDRFATVSTIAGAYFKLGELGNETSESGAGLDACIGKVERLASSDQVVAQCDPRGCVSVAAAELDARQLVCGGMDDIAVAMTGLHPKDVFVTRLEARLPSSALGADLQLVAASDQRAVASRFVAGLSVNNCWDSERAQVLPPSGGSRQPPLRVVLWTMCAAAMLLSWRRRRYRGLKRRQEAEVSVWRTSWTADVGQRP